MEGNKGFERSRGVSENNIDEAGGESEPRFDMDCKVLDGDPTEVSPSSPNSAGGRAVVVRCGVRCGPVVVVDALPPAGIFNPAICCDRSCELRDERCFLAVEPSRSCGSLAKEYNL